MLINHRQPTRAVNVVVAHVETGNSGDRVIGRGRSRGVGSDRSRSANGEGIVGTSGVGVLNGALGHRGLTDGDASGRTLNAALKHAGQLSLGGWGSEAACGQSCRCTNDEAECAFGVVHWEVWMAARA